MSLKTFYQTFYQNEQLFRLPDEPAWPALTTSATVADVVSAAENVVAPASADDNVVERPEPLLAEAPDTLLVDALVELPTADAPTNVVTERPTPVPVVPQPIGTNVVNTPTEKPPRRSAEGPVALRPAAPLLSQKVLILVDEEMLPSDLLFLEKVLKAVNLDVKGVDLLNIQGLRGVDFRQLLADRAVHHFFTFGPPFTAINLDILMDRYAPVRFDGITFMMADSLATIEADRELKKRLWAALQRIFLWK